MRSFPVYETPLSFFLELADGQPTPTDLELSEMAEQLEKRTRAAAVAALEEIVAQYQVQARVEDEGGKLAMSKPALAPEVR